MVGFLQILGRSVLVFQCSLNMWGLSRGMDRLRAVVKSPSHQTTLPAWEHKSCQYRLGLASKLRLLPVSCLLVSPEAGGSHMWPPQSSTCPWKQPETYHLTVSPFTTGQITNRLHQITTGIKETPGRQFRQRPRVARCQTLHKSKLYGQFD